MSSLEDWSEHGLGLYVDPIGKHGARPNRLPGKERRRVWIAEFWDYLLARVQGLDQSPPGWADRYALTQFAISNPKLLRWFAKRDASVPAEERMRPGSFGLLAQPTQLVGALAGNRLPAAVFEDDATKWPDLSWYDRGGSGPVRVAHLDP